MKQIKQMMILSLCMCIANVSFAATHVVVFNPQAAILRTDKAQQQLEAMRKDGDFVALQTRLETLKSDLETLSKERDTKGMTWSADQTAEHRKKMESVGSDYQYTAKKMQSEQQAVMERIIQEMQPLVQKAMSEVVAAEGADLVLDGQAAFFASPKADITAKVTEKLNKAK